VAVCCRKKCIRKKERWGMGEEGRLPGHKFNIIDEIILLITPLVI